MWFDFVFLDIVFRSRWKFGFKIVAWSGATKRRRRVLLTTARTTCCIASRVPLPLMTSPMTPSSPRNPLPQPEPEVNAAHRLRRTSANRRLSWAWQTFWTCELPPSSEDITSGKMAPRLKRSLGWKRLTSLKLCVGTAVIIILCAEATRTHRPTEVYMSNCITIFVACQHAIIIIIIIIPMTTFIVLSSWPQGHCESSLGSFDECKTAPSSRRPSDQATWLGLWVRLWAAIVYNHHRYLLLLLSPKADTHLPSHGG